jgi:uncharacterized protein
MDIELPRETHRFRTTSILGPSALRYTGYALASVLGVASIGITGLAAYLSSRISRPRRSHRPPHFTFTPWEFQIPYREVVIPVGNDELSAWFLPQPDPNAPCIIGLSGFGSQKAELLGISSNLHRDGFAILLIDFRGSGRSRGDVVTMGHNESEDARAAVDWLRGEVPNAPIGVIGYSMGGSVALMLAALDDRVQAVVSDSAFATQRAIFAHHIRRRTGVWPTPVLIAAAPMLKRRHGRGYDDFSPAANVGRISPRPLLLIHPRDDQIVPFEHAEQIWENAGEPKKGWFPEGIAHCGAYFHDRAGYCRRVSKFFRDALSSVPQEDRGTEKADETMIPPA